jgi:hypothetical protein
VFRYFNTVIDIKKNRAFFESIHSLLPKKKPLLGALLKPKLDAIEEEQEPDTKKRAMSQEEIIESELKIDIMEDHSLENRLTPDKDKIPDQLLPSFASKDSGKDLFKTFFCRHFDTILKINKNEALNLEKQIVDPLVLELGAYINLEPLQQTWAAGKTLTTKDKILLKLLAFGRWLKNGVIWLATLTFVTLMNFFTNQFVIILIETVLAVIYVVYSTPSFIIYPIILWIFFNVYPKFDSIIGLNLKIWLLMLPTGINCLLAKRRVNTDLTTSKNPDFNFNYKAEYNVIDFSTLGVVLMSFVILEMILMASRKSATSVSGSLDSSVGVHKVSKTFLTISSMIYNNAIYLIMLNIYVIALDINLISFGLIIYFIRLILVRQIGPKTYYTLFWYNQVSILLRYIYNHLKPKNQATDSIAFQFYRFVGVQESDNIAATTKLLLNFSLQLWLILVIFNIRNKEVFEKMTEAEEDHATKMAFSETSGTKRVAKNLYEFLKYSAFHCLPWLAYMVIYLAMIFTSTSIVTLMELIYLCYLLVSHLRLSIENRFGGLDKMKGLWKGLVSFCAFMALSRYCIWFIAQEYLQMKFSAVKNMSTFIKEKLNFIGLLPKDFRDAYLELLPSFLAMYLGSLVLHRITMVEYTLSHEAEIMSLDIEEADNVPVINIMRDEEDLENQLMAAQNPDSPKLKAEKRGSIFHKRASVVVQQDIKVRLTQKERDEYQSKKLKLKARREVIGDINIFQ